MDYPRDAGGQLQGAPGQRLGDLAVGGDQPDAGTPLQQVVDVHRALVGHPEDQLGQRDRHPSEAGASSSASSSPVRRAVARTSAASVP